MYCNKCSNLAARGSRYCRHCGAELDQPGAATLIPDAAYVVHSPFDPVNAEEVRQYVSEALELSEKGDVTAAIGGCHKAIALDPESVSAHSLLASLYERISDEEKAIKAYEIVVRLDPLNKLDSQRLHELYKKAGKSPPPDPSPEKFASTGDPELGQSWPYTQTAPLVLVASLSIFLIYMTQQFVPLSRATPHPRVEVEGLGVPVQTAKVTERWSQYLAQAVQSYKWGNFERAEYYIRLAVGERPDDLKLRQYLRVVEQKAEEARNPSPISVNEPAEPMSVATRPQNHDLPTASMSSLAVSPLPGPYGVLPSPDMRRRPLSESSHSRTVVPRSNPDGPESRISATNRAIILPNTGFRGFALPAPEIPQRQTNLLPDGRVERRQSTLGPSMAAPPASRALQRAIVRVKPQVAKSFPAERDDETALVRKAIVLGQADMLARVVAPRMELSAKELEKIALRALRGKKPDYDTAISRMSEALGRVTDPQERAGIHEQIGLIYRRASQPQEAWKQLNRAAKLYERIGAERDRSRCLLAVELLLSPPR